MLILSDWDPLGKDFYRKQDIFSVSWADKIIDMRKCHIAAASFGGPIAFIRDSNKFKSSGSYHEILYIFTCSGNEISARPWNSGRLMKMGWSESQDLICVQEDGTVLFYNVFGEAQDLKTFTMGHEVKDTKVIDAKFFNNSYGTGIVVLTGAYRFFMVTNVDNPRTKGLSDIPGLRAPPSSWEVIIQEQKSKVLVARDLELELLEEGSRHTRQLEVFTKETSSYIEIVVSQSYKRIAILSSCGKLWLGNALLEKPFYIYDTMKTTKPQHMAWCTDSAVVGVWGDLMLIIGLRGDCIRHIYDGPVFLIPELDCLRIITNNSHEILEKVPDDSLNVFQIGSMKPGALLMEAWKAFESQSTRAHDYITSIEDQLAVAIDECIAAATFEWDSKNQKKLLQAAHFGKLLLQGYNSTYFVKTCQMLRVLNNLRDSPIGIPLTYRQLDVLSYQVLIDRLVLHREFLLALLVCDFLHLPVSEGRNRVLFHWACFKVDQNKPQEEIAAAITGKIGEIAGVSYSQIASRAHNIGKKDLAVHLLDFEPHVREVVKQLIEMDLAQKALPKAIASGDPELVHLVLEKLKISWGSNFLIEVRKYPMAHALYLQSWREANNLKKFHDILKQEDNFAQQARCYIREAYSAQNIEDRKDALKNAQNCFTNSKNEWAAKQTEEQLALLKRQQLLERELNRSGAYIDKSVHETITQLITDNQLKKADEFQREFKVSERRYWWIKIQALAANGDWAELSRFSGLTKKPPIGFESFVEVCMNYDKKVEAEKYLKLVTPEFRAKACLKMGLLEEAVEAAFVQKCEEDLNLILSRCASTNRPLAEKINSLKAQLISKK